MVRDEPGRCKCGILRDVGRLDDNRIVDCMWIGDGCLRIQS